MNTRTPLIASTLLAASLISGAAHAALLGRDLNGSIDSFEAYYDTDLNITWLADANYAKTRDYDANADGRINWNYTNAWVSNLSFYNPLINQTYANWRLPTVNPVNGVSFNYSASNNGSTDSGYNISEQGTAFAGSTGSEMAHLFYNTLNNKAYCDPALSTASVCSYPQAGWGLTNSGPFSNLKAGLYWSDTVYAPSKGSSLWAFFFDYGFQTGSSMSNEYYSLAVSPGDVGVGIAAVPEPETYAMMLAGLGLIGAMARRRKIAKV